MTVYRSMLFALAATLITVPAMAQRPTYHPAVSRERAVAVATARVPGALVASELEREHGRWIWSFEIRTASAVMEVNVDAETGAVVEVSRD